MKSICIMLGVTAALLKADEPLEIRVPAGAQPVFQRLDLIVERVPEVANPFDPDQIAIDLEVIAPSGKKQTVPGFWAEDFERTLERKREVLTSKGAGQWEVRFLPLETGRHELKVFARVAGRQVGQGSTAIEVGPNAAAVRGFVRATAGQRYFHFDDGTPLFLNGLCACWHGSRGTFDYDDWLAAYEKAGINYIRLWMSPMAFGIELEKEDRVHYRLDRAWTLDRVLAEAERRGIYVMLCLDYHGMFETKPDFWKSNNHWPRHPYNVANGGPCENQDEFFTKEAAKELYRKRLRYIVARWSAYPNVLAWEFFNEIDNVYRYLNHEHVVAWHREMGAYLKSIDPYRHLVTSSFTGGSERPDLYALKEMDFSQYHSYNEKHPAEMTAKKAIAFWERYRKPFFVSEYGTDWKGWKPETDPHLRALHQAIWSGAFSGAAGTGMTWWWESVHQNNLYPHWSALAQFLKESPIAAADLRPVEIRSEGQPVKAWGVATPRSALVYVLDAEMNWPEGAMVDNPSEVKGAIVKMSGLEHGTYRTEWWDTRAGKIVTTTEARLEAELLVLEPPPFQVDLAAKIRKL